jgi:hypothetical protein
MRNCRRRPQPRWRAGHLRPRADVDPAPPTITRTNTSFATKVSPDWTPNALSLLGHPMMSPWLLKLFHWLLMRTSARFQIFQPLIIMCKVRYGLVNSILLWNKKIYWRRKAQTVHLVLCHMCLFSKGLIYASLRRRYYSKMAPCMLSSHRKHQVDRLGLKECLIKCFASLPGYLYYFYVLDS